MGNHCKTVGKSTAWIRQPSMVVLFYMDSPISRKEYMHNSSIVTQPTKATVGIIILDTVFIVGGAVSFYALLLNINHWMTGGNQASEYDRFMIVVRIAFTCAIASFCTLTLVYLFKRKKRSKELAIFTARLYLIYVIISQVADILYFLTIGYTTSINPELFRFLIFFLPSALLSIPIPVAIILYAKHSKHLSAYLSNE